MRKFQLDLHRISVAEPVGDVQYTCLANNRLLNINSLSEE